METWDAIRSRRNVRHFSDRPLAPEALDRVLEAGRRTPSSTNWQPWDFVVVTDRQQLRALARVWRGAFHVARSQATIDLVAPYPLDEIRYDWMRYDFGQATMAMMLAAADLGVGSGQAGWSPTRTGPGPCWASPRPVLPLSIYSLRATRPTARSGPSCGPTAARSTRSSTGAGGRGGATGGTARGLSRCR